MFEIYTKLALYALFPVLLSVAFYLLSSKTKFKNLSYSTKQIIIGVCFGLGAIFGTEFGVNMYGATINARDAAPLCAGLLFGGPAGIIAGIIGGVERWFAVYWGAGMYSRLACSVSTFLAGVFAAVLRKYMFDDKRPTWGVGFAVAVVMEVIHMTVMFITNISDTEQAIEIVKVCTFPMILTNGFSVLLSIVLISLFSTGKIKEKTVKKKISQQVQSWLLVIVIGAYLLTTGFVYVLQTYSAINQANSLIINNLTDIRAEIESRISQKSSYDILEETKEVIQNRRIGESGYYVACEADKKSLISPKGENINVEAITNSGGEYTRIQTQIGGEDVFCMYVKTDEMCVIAIIPSAEVFSLRDTDVFINSFMEIIVFALFFAVIYFLIKKLVVNNIREINADLSRIIDGDLNITVDVHSSDEFSSLSDDINTTVTTLKHYIDEAAARIDNELKLAQQIQYSALPAVFPSSELFEAYASMHTAKEVGGDFYDIYMISETKLAFTIADVSGKGIPAAMFMMTSKAMLQSLAQSGSSLSEVFNKTNERLCKENTAGMFVTAWMGVLDTETGVVKFVNAGHNPPIICRKNGECEYVRAKSGFILAGMETVKYTEHELVLNPGDCIYLYTDGVTEAANLNKELYGEERLCEYLKKCKSKSVKETLKGVKDNVDCFAGEAEQFDDITMLMVEYKGKIKNKIFKKSFVAKDENLYNAINFAEEVLNSCEVPSDVIMTVTLAIEELFVNVAHYAYADSDEEGDITLTVTVDEKSVSVEFSDHGKEFNPLLKDDPDVSLSAEDREIGGLGIFMVKNVMDEVDYKYENGMNILTVEKNL